LLIDEIVKDTVMPEQVVTIPPTCAGVLMTVMFGVTGAAVVNEMQDDVHGPAHPLTLVTSQ
jgi:hypothetical protein